MEKKPKLVDKKIFQAKTLNLILPTLAIAAILGLSAFLLWQKLGNGNNGLSSRAGVFSVSGPDQYPKFFRELIIDPATNVSVGEKQKFFIWAKDIEGIQSVSLIIKSREDEKGHEIELRLIEGDKQEGKWFGEWQVKRLTEGEKYTATFRAQNQRDKHTELTTFFDVSVSSGSLWNFFRAKPVLAYSECHLNDMGSTAINSTCFIPTNTTMGTNGGSLVINSPIEMETGSTLGAEGGDITINSTVTMGANSTMIFNQGRKISLPSSSSYILKQTNNSIIKKDHLSFYNLAVSKLGLGTVNSTNVTGISCGSDCSNYYVAGTSVTLAAAAASGYTFSGWSGACSGTGTCTISMTANKSVTATFTLNTYTLSVNSSGASSISITGSPSAYSGTTNYTKSAITSGTSLSLIAPASSGSYTFSSWSGCNSVGGTSNRTCNVTMNSNKAVTASYACASATCSSLGKSCGNWSDGCGGTLYCGTCSGSTDCGYGTCSSSQRPSWYCDNGTCRYSCYNSSSCISTYRLTVSKGGTGSGTVTSNPSGISCGSDCYQDYNSGTVVALYATAASGSTFAGWSGGGCSGTGNCNVTMDSSKTVTATFNTSVVYCAGGCEATFSYGQYGHCHKDCIPYADKTCHGRSAHTSWVVGNVCHSCGFCLCSSNLSCDPDPNAGDCCSHTTAIKPTATYYVDNNGHCHYNCSYSCVSTELGAVAEWSANCSGIAAAGTKGCSTSVCSNSGWDNSSCPGGGDPYWYPCDPSGDTCSNSSVCGQRIDASVLVKTVEGTVTCPGGQPITGRCVPKNSDDYVITSEKSGNSWYCKFGCSGWFCTANGCGYVYCGY